MFKMTAEMSWGTVLVLVLLVAAVMWLVHELTKAAEQRRRARAAAAADDGLAPVRELRPATSGSHLSLVPELPQRPEPELYDWEIQGA